MTKGELINTNEPFCVCVDAHPHFFLTRLRVLRMRVFCVYFGSLISELHCTYTHTLNPKKAICSIGTWYIN